MISICIFGSSKPHFAKTHEKDIRVLIETLFEIFNEVRIINGGYSGIMEISSKIATEISSKKNKKLEVIGILYDGYNEFPNKFNNKVITCKNLGERIQTMIELADIYIALPGELGTFHEILHLSQELEYPSKINSKLRHENFILHEFWRKHIDNPKWKYFNDSMGDLTNILMSAVKNEEQKLKICTLKIDTSANFEEAILKLSENIDNSICQPNVSMGSNVLGIDLAYSLYNPEKNEKHAKNYSYSCKEYSSVLDDYFNTYHSLVKNNIEAKMYRYLNNDITDKGDDKVQIIPKEMDFKSNKVISNFNTWTNYLEQKKMGKLTLWINKKIQIQGAIVNLSSFLLLDTILPKNIIHTIFDLVEDFLYKHLIYNVETYIDRLKLTLLELNDFKIIKYNGANDKHGRRLETDHLKSHNKQELLNIASEVMNRIKFDIEHNFTYSGKENISFTLLEDISEFNPFRKFLKGRMFVLVYYLIFKKTLTETNNLVYRRNKKFALGDFQKTFAIEGLGSDIIEDEKIKQKSSFSSIIPHISEAEYQLLIAISKEFRPTLGIDEEIKINRQGFR